MSTREKLFVFWTLLLPFVIWGGIFEGAKVVWFLAGGLFLSIIWLFKLRDKIPDLLGWPDFLFLAWIFVLLVASILGIDPIASILGGSYRHQGVLFFFALWLVGKTVSLLPADSKTFLAKALALSVFVEAVIVILQKLFGVIYFGRPLGTFGEPNAAAGFLAVASVFGFEKLKKERLVVFSLIVLFAIFSTQSRAAILAFLFVVFGRLITASKNFRIPAFVVLSATVAISSLVFLQGAVARPQSEYESRSLYWKVGWQQVLQKPFLGYGAESGEAVYEKAFAEAKNPLDLIVDRSHNLFLDVAMWSGFLGLLFFSAWLSAEFKKLKDWGLRFAFLGWLAFAMFQPLGVAHWVLLVVLTKGRKR